MDAHKWFERTTAALAVLMVLALVSMAAPIAAAHAATTRMIGIDDTSDAFPMSGCSLREAIDIANAGLTGTHYGCTVNQTGSGVPITYRIYLLEKGPYVYTLTGASGEDGNASGDLDIMANVIISGGEMGSIIIDGGGIDRVLHICPGGGCGNSVTLTGVTVRNGNTVGYGGGIYNEGDTLTVDDSTIRDNEANNGGGIYNDDGILDVQNGAIVSDNQATSLGGGIYVLAGTVTVDGGTISYNQAYSGGGIRNFGGMLKVQNDSTVTNNTALGSDGRGGGIYNADTTTVDGSTVYENTTTGSNGRGGGIYNSDTLHVQNGSTISDNTATDDGGGIYNEDGTVTVDDSSVNDNSAVDGGGIFSDDGTLTVQNGSIISFNEADRGGGIYNDWDSTTTVDGSTIRSNDVALYGGGIHNLGGTLTVQNGSIIGGAGTSNMAQRGGGICNYGTATVDGSTVSGNTADSGGGIFHEAGTFTVQNGSIIGGAGASNTATGYGGGIHILPGGTVIVNGSIVSANTASGGGGIYSRGTTIVNGGTISGNEAGSGGGGVYNYEGTLTVSGGTVSGNSAISGGGIYNYEGLTTVMDSRILNNTAIHGRGGGVLNRATLIDATNVTDSCIVGNSDTAFFNDEAAVQFAVGNWWGAASGPSGSGPGTGDSVSTNVDYSDYLTERILGCGYYYIYLPLVVR